MADHLGEPWAKQDSFTTGSGLSIHLAYRIIDLMGGTMQIASAPMRGCGVSLEVPLQRRSPLHPSQPSSVDMNSHASIHDLTKRKIALIGFDRPDKAVCGLPARGQTLRKQYHDLGYEVVSGYDADVLVVNGDVEELEAGRALMVDTKVEEIVFLTLPGHEPHPEVAFAARKHGKFVRRIAKPVTPSVIRQTLGRPRHHVGCGSPSSAIFGFESVS